MISLKNNEINRESVIEPIIRWEVWFVTPGGLHEKQETAVKWCRDRDLDPDDVVVPVAVAVSKSAHEVATRA